VDRNISLRGILRRSLWGGKVDRGCSGPCSALVLVVSIRITIPESFLRSRINKQCYSNACMAFCDRMATRPAAGRVSLDLVS
jgi:hypothetical protein